MEGPYIAEVASLIGDPARANILVALMGGQSLTAKELAFVAGVSASTTSGHLARLVSGELILATAQGRHRYFRIASPQVAEMIEALMGVAFAGPRRHRPRSIRDAALAEARTCYNHLAGRVAVALADALNARGLIELDHEAGVVTEAGERFLADFGVGLDRHRGRSLLCRPCLDWSERRPHVGGRLGAVLLTRFDDLSWVRRVDNSRALQITVAGRRGFGEVFGIDHADNVGPLAAAGGRAS